MAFFNKTTNQETPLSSIPQSPQFCGEILANDCLANKLDSNHPTLSQSILAGFSRRIQQWQQSYQNLSFMQQKITYVMYAALAFLLLYSVSGRYYIGTPVDMRLTWVDHYIPFWVWTFWIYVSDYPFLMLAGLLAPNQEQFRKFRSAFWLVMLAHLIAFMLFPTRIFIHPVTGTGLSDSLARFVQSLDVPCNCCPSMHVSMSFLAAVVLATAYRRWSFIFITWGILIILSTLTAKQHACYDVIGGMILGLSAFAFVYGRDSQKHSSSQKKHQT